MGKGNTRKAAATAATLAERLRLRESDFDTERVVQTLCGIVLRDRAISHYCESVGFYTVEERGRGPFKSRDILFEIAESRFERTGQFLDEMLHADYRHKEDLERNLAAQLNYLEAHLQQQPPEEILDEELDRTQAYFRESKNLYGMFSELLELSVSREEKSERFRELGKDTVRILHNMFRLPLQKGKTRWHCHSNGEPPTKHDVPRGDRCELVIIHDYEREIEQRLVLPDPAHDELRFTVYLVDSQSQNLLYEHR